MHYTINKWEAIQKEYHTLTFLALCINWESIEFPARVKDWKRFERNKTIALNILFVPDNEKTNLAYKSKYNCKCKNQVVLLMSTDGKKWHYIALKSECTEDGFNHPKKVCLNYLEE